MSTNHSIISSMLGEDLYDFLKIYSKIIAKAGTIVLAIAICVSANLHFKLISSVFSLITGSSLLFLIYILSVIIYLDNMIESLLDKKNENINDSKKVKIQQLSTVVLIAIGVLAIVYTNNLRKHYAFECETFLVDKEDGIYHLNLENEHIDAQNANTLVQMKGYEVEEAGYSFCEWCEEFAEEAEETYESMRYYRK